MGNTGASQEINGSKTEVPTRNPDFKEYDSMQSQPIRLTFVHYSNTLAALRLAFLLSLAIGCLASR